VDLEALAAAVTEAQRTGDERVLAAALWAEGWQYRRRTTPEEIQALVLVDGNGCWLWTGSVDRYGYGRHRGRRAHIESYEAHVGPVPKGLHLDHLCRVTFCVNPEHLEPVTPAENTRRAMAARQAGPHARAHHGAQLWCIRGHEFDEKNTGVDRWGKRYCKRCRADHTKDYRRNVQGQSPVGPQFRIDLELYAERRPSLVVRGEMLTTAEAAERLGVGLVVFRGWLSRYKGVLTDQRYHRRTGYRVKWLADEVDLLGQCRTSEPWSRQKKPSLSSGG
jgi:HNH endonuclease